MPTPANALGWRLLSAAVLSLLLLAAPAQAQDPPNLKCIQQYNAVKGQVVFDPAVPAQVANGCALVATALADDWPTGALFGATPAVDPRDLSATRDQTTTAPGEATPAVEPVEAAGGSVAAVGTEKGAGAVAAIAINPSIFFVDPSNTDQVARWSRFTDVTLLVPASNLEGDEENEEDNNEGTDYVGLRWGLNFTGLQQGSELHQAVVNAYNQFLNGQRVQNEQIRALFTAAESDEDLKECIQAMDAAESLDAEALESITEACGGAPDPDDPNIITGLREAIEAARIQADSRYLGLDLRADFGDLSLAGVDTVPGTSFFGGFGWGRRSVRGTDAATGLRAHGGVRYWDVDDEEEGGEEDDDQDDANWSVEGGLAFEAIRFYDYQRLTLVAGLDGRWQGGGLADDDEAGSIHLRGSLNVPVTATTSVSVNLAAPLVGERRAPVLSIKGNWRLLRSRSF
jgi:hypothetical protein